MKGVVYVAKDTVEVRDLPMPVTAANEIMVKIEYCAVCATDVHVVSHGLYGLQPPMVMGHEACGTIVEVGEEAAKTCSLKVEIVSQLVPFIFADNVNSVKRVW